LTHDVIVTLAALGVAGQVLAALLLLVGIGWLVGLRGMGEGLRRTLEGYELWLVFLVASIATGGSLFFSEIAGFVPCELCWFQRICMYPLSIVSLLAALANDRRVARYLLPLPLVGAGVSVYHLLVENGVVAQAQTCLISAPGGCATKWIEEFGYVTIPVLALTGFALCFAFLLLGAAHAPSRSYR
jgi:disulfide bond formation protein DsbB